MLLQPPTAQCGCMVPIWIRMRHCVTCTWYTLSTTKALSHFLLHHKAEETTRHLYATQSNHFSNIQQNMVWEHNNGRNGEEGQ